MTSFNNNIWKLIDSDDRKAELISQRYALPFLIAKILSTRVDVDDVSNFIDPKLQNLLPNPHSLKDVAKAAAKIADAVKNNKKIGIIGDYDVDGATSSALLRLFLESVGNNPLVHIPERDEGYGPSIKCVDGFIAQGVEIIITVDCGTTAFEVVEYATTQGIEVIIIDHHEAEVKLPKAYAIINPKRLDETDSIPYLKYMAAVGVVFLTTVAVNRALREEGFYQQHPEPDLKKWLDLVALGTVCDVVPLIGLNRAFVKQGLKIMAQRTNFGIKALLDKANVSESPSAYHLGFVLGPRINASGRVGDSSLGHKLLCARSDIEAQKIAEDLDKFNAERKEIENYVMLNAIELLESTPQEFPIAFVAGRDWHQGVIGIVAGKLKERYNIPSFVMSIEKDEVKGSARSIKGVDLGALIISAKEKGLITKGGGHTMAAGFSLNQDQIEGFKNFVGEYVKNAVGEEELTPIIEVSAMIDLMAATPDFAEKLELLEPFGAGNPEPKFLIEHAKISRAKIVGSGHVSCFLGSDNGGSVKAIAFRTADSEMGKSLLNNNFERYKIIGTMRRDTWQGRTSIQFMIEDMDKE